MNFRNTFVLFGLFLGMLWLFGLMVSIKRSSKEETFVMPIFHADQDDITVTSLRVERGRGEKKDEYVFTKTEGGWRMQQPPTKRTVKVEEFRVKNIIRQVADAQAASEVDTGGSRATYGLDNPSTTVTITGRYKDKPEQTWQFFVGNQSQDKAYYYVNSSERRQVHGVKKSGIEAVLLEDINQFRPQRIFETIESEVKSFALKEQASEVELKKTEEATWQFVKPPLGQADTGGAPPPSKIAAVPPPKQEDTGVKGLLGAILGMRVEPEHFVPVSDAPLAGFGLEDGKEALRLEVLRTEEKKEAKETLLIGNKEKDMYYARVAGDEGVFKLPAKSLEPVFAVLKDPGTLRSRDLLTIETRKVDAINIHKGKDVIELRDTDPWHVAAGDKNWRKAGRKTIETLLETLQGKREIREFLDKREDKDLGLDDSSVKVDLWIEGIDKEKKDDKDKQDKDKKPDPKKVDPKLKDTKPAARLEFGKIEGDNVYVKRTVWIEIADKEKKEPEKDKKELKEAKDKKEQKKEKKYEERITRVVVPKSILDKLTPKEAALAFLDTSLPAVENEDVVQIVVEREKKEPVEVRRNPFDDSPTDWFLQKQKDLAGTNIADANQVRIVLGTLTGLQAHKWLLKVDPKEDLEKYGLKTPVVTATLVKKTLQPRAVATLVGMAAPGTGSLQMAAALHRTRVLDKDDVDKGETIVFKFGKETKEDDKTYVYAQHSGSDLLFLVSPEVVRTLREADVRDRRGVGRFQAVIDAGLAGTLASPANAVSYLLTAAPLVTGTVQRFDVDKVTEIKLAVRTPFEMRKVHFVRSGEKEASWQVKSGFEGLMPDAEKIKKFLDDMATLRAEGFVQLWGPSNPEHKLDDAQATLKIELEFKGARLVVSVGDRVDFGAFFARTNYWRGPDQKSEMVFLLSSRHVQPLLDPGRYFGKERVASGP